MEEISFEPQVYLGNSIFILKGLNQEQIKKVHSSWGPFLKLSKAGSHSSQVDQTLAHSDSTPHLARSPIEPWVIQFRHDPPPSELKADYQRGDDLFLCISQPPQQHAVSWIDGSLGAIEASIQVILQRALAQREGLLVHASAGVYQGQGILVPGPSGIGKSTIAREAGFDQVLSDEMIIIEKLPLTGTSTRSDTGSDLQTSLKPTPCYQIFSTPFWSEGRTLPLLIAQAPLSFIFCPVQSTQSKLIDCSKAQAITHLMSSITLYELSSAPLDKHKPKLFDIACHICVNTLSKKLLFPKYGPWLHLLSWS